MPNRADAVCLLGHHEPDYPRNRSVREALEAAGFRVFECHSRAPFPLRHLILAGKYLRVAARVRWVWVTEGGHRLVPFLKLLTALTRRRLAFDPFLSRYNTRIEDRRLYRPGGLQAWICLWQDWSSTHAADALAFDTLEHQRYFESRYRLRKPACVLPVGVDETLFAPVARAAVPRPYAQDGFQVLFYGTYIPLQGAEWIMEAAALLGGSGIRFTCIGRGQTFAETEARARALRVDNVDLLPNVATEALIPYLAHADVCLGIFGNTVKAAHVVPNKVVQAAAMGKPIVTRDSDPVRRYFRDGESIFLVPPSSPRALADALLALRDDPALRVRLSHAARRAFEAGFSKTALARILKDFLA
jgi:glycosyltransferase involved in cell wall biosynthesis